MRKKLLKEAKRVVVKIGTAALSNASGGLDAARVQAFAEQVHALKERGLQVAVVTSGAIGAGMDLLGLKRRPTRLPELQACAAVGQGRLMSIYDDCFRRYGYHASQILLTRQDIENRRRYLNTSNAINAILEYGAVPLINENDTISVEEIDFTFGDNDGLAALVTSLVRADLLILLTVVDGVFENPDASAAERKILAEVKTVNDDILALASSSKTRGGRGGMTSKLEAAQVATAAGEPALIANALTDNILERIFDGEEIGTFFCPATSRMKSRKRWLRFGNRPKGTLTIDAGAVGALVERGKSLLPSGITEVVGDFAQGDLVTICDTDRNDVAWGLVNYSANDMTTIQGHKTSDIRRLLGDAPYQEAIHRDHLVLND
jgi:glutamate 5-kinase